ncbi:PspA/IM30 family protein [Bacillus sp. FJAT-45350]|uniref:PspA/IM30 family protein n=1 Tax=Bacillus sp. FJAT-45350 TaxID=2011014 RepID=UPI000BB835EB|nr:PspA/IM30 family protein [Bacillus sp. FJAT-45350]
MVFRRIRDITMATIHEGLNQIENPVSMLNQYLRDLDEEINKGKEAITKQMMLESKFQNQQQEMELLAAKRLKQAELALKAGEEVLARKAFYEKKRYEEKAEYYKDLAEKNQIEVLDLKENLEAMLEKFTQLRDKKNALLARANAARTKEKMHEAIVKFDSEQAEKGFARMEERIFEMETRNRVSMVDEKEFVGTPVLLDEKLEQEFTNLKQRVTN